jgi:LacI family transcriptional regulator
LRALSEKGLSHDGLLITAEEWTREGGRKAMDRFFTGKNGMDAVFCGNDLLAIGAMEAVRKSGRTVPGDIAVVGFDDIELASLVTPQITTVRQSQEQVASSACNLLFDRISGKEQGKPKEILIEPELIVRESA